jgi:hypothetical protein
MLLHVNQQGYLQTGQTTCHDVRGMQVSCGGSGQDAEFQRGLAWPTPRFQPREEVVVDQLTGLTWTTDANPSVYPLNWQEAFVYVSQMNGDKAFGYSDWRLPNRRELRSLVSQMVAVKFFGQAKVEGGSLVSSRYPGDGEKFIEVSLKKVPETETNSAPWIKGVPWAASSGG